MMGSGVAVMQCPPRREGAGRGKKEMESEREKRRKEGEKGERRE